VPGLLLWAPSAVPTHTADVSAVLPCIQVGLHISMRCLALLNYVLHREIENLSQTEVRESYQLKMAVECH